MVSAAISWYGAAKPSFVNNNGIKINKENYCWHLRKELFPAIEKVIKRDDWIFSQDGAPSHRFHLVQDFLNAKFEMLFHPYQRMASILTWCKSTGLFLLGLCSDQSLRRKIWKAVCIRSWTKEKKNLFGISVRITKYRWGKQSNNLSDEWKLKKKNKEEVSKYCLVNAFT